jgi:hypothetical protein
MLEKFYKTILPYTSVYQKNKPKIYSVFHLFTASRTYFGLNGLHQGLQQNTLVLMTYSSFVAVSDGVHFGRNILDGW